MKKQAAQKGKAVRSSVKKSSTKPAKKPRVSPETSDRFKQLTGATAEALEADSAVELAEAPVFDEQTTPEANAEPTREPSMPTDPDAYPDPSEDASTATAAAQQPAAKVRGPARDMSLQGPATTPWTFLEVVDGYCAAVSARSPERATGANYRRQLQPALDHFGGNATRSTFTPLELTLFADSPTAHNTPKGKVRAKPTYDQVLRCTRQALAWAGWI